MLFEVLALTGLEIEPCIGNCTDVWKKSLNEWMELILKKIKNTDGKLDQELLEHDNMLRKSSANIPLGTYEPIYIIDTVVSTEFI